MHQEAQLSEEPRKVEQEGSAYEDVVAVELLRGLLVPGALGEDD